MEKIYSVINSQGKNLKVILSYPDDKKKYPIVISTHGFASGKNNKTNRLLKPKVLENNCAFLRFDFMGHYDSEGDISELTISSGLDDLNSVINDLTKYSFIDTSKMYLFGTSYGGNVVLWYLAKNDKIKAAVLKAPVSDYAQVRENQLGVEGIKNWEKDGFTYVEGSGGQVKTNFNFYLDSKNVDTYSLAKNIKCKVLIIHGDIDDNVPVQQSKNLSEKIADSELFIIKDANHGFKGEGQLEHVIDLTIKFFKANF